MNSFRWWRQGGGRGGRGGSGDWNCVSFGKRREKQKQEKWVEEWRRRPVQESLFSRGKAVINLDTRLLGGIGEVCVRMCVCVQAFYQWWHVPALLLYAALGVAICISVRAAYRRSLTHTIIRTRWTFCCSQDKISFTLFSTTPHCCDSPVNQHYEFE